MQDDRPHAPAARGGPDVAGARVEGDTGTGELDVAAAYDDHARALFAFAVNALGDRGAAEEAVQETFARAWRGRQRYDAARASARTWLFGIARHVVSEEYRRRRRRGHVVPLDDPLAGVDGGAAVAGHAEGVLAGPEEQAVNRLLVAEVVERLTPEHRHVVVEVYLRGRTYADVATETGVPVATLRTRMFYGLKALRGHLEEVGWHGAGG